MDVNATPQSPTAENAADSYRIEGLGEQFEEIFQRRDHLLVPLSPFNGYYSPARIDSIIKWASSKFSSFDVVTPGDEAALTLIALGEPAGHAYSLTYAAIRKLTRRAREALQKAGAGDNAQVHTWTQLRENPRYKELREDLLARYRGDRSFREFCHDASREVLSANLKPGVEPTTIQLELCSEYVLAELPFLLDTPQILGIRSSIASYHRHCALYSGTYSGTLPVQPSRHQAGAIISPSPSLE
ncbi:tRNA-dependent cyclodipeptide synthase [Streptomyces sp. NPDC056254]|uniref:tRNA-dependent cyclodipeptide synthase n=1 Tax=Streptomyces sp. NPDC056254 TaxID=3345763 RepID=UPI0035DC5EE1